MIPFHSVNKIIIPLFILSLTYILVQYLPACKNLEYKYNDLDQKAAYAIRKKPALGKEAVFVLIDPKTDTAFKYRTPYPRKIIAEILIKLKSCFPRLIVMDYVFMGTSDDKQEDQRLVKAIEKTQPILFSYVQSDGSVYPVPDLFTHYAKGTGIVSLIRDSDGVHRSMRPFYFDKASMKQYYCALALLALEYFRLPFSVLDVDLTTDSLVVKDPRSPLKPAYYGKKCRMEFKHYYRLKDTQAVSFIDVYENRVSPEFFKDKVVFLGRESNIHHDIHRSPLGLELGCVIVYNIFLTYINNAFPVPLNPVYHFLLSVLLVLLSFSFLNRTSIMKKWIITLSMLVWVFLIQYLFFCLNISWRGFVPFSAILLMAVGREAYYHILIFREINKIKNLLIINPQTHLTHSSYFLARLRSLASEHKMYEETYYTGVIAINGQETGADLSAAGLRNIADMLNKKIRYRELLSWDADRKKLYFILKGERSGKMEKRLKKYFFEPVLSYLKNNLTAQAAVSIVFLKSGSIFPHSVYGFLDAMDSEVKKSKDTPIHYMDHFQPTRLHDEEMEYNMFSDTKYVLEQIQNTLSLDEKLKLSEKEIRISNKLAGVGKIAAQIAHELKNPLGNILNMKSWFEEYIGNDHPAHECIQALEEETVRLQNICGQILQFSHPAKEVKSHVNLNHIIADTLRFLQATFKKHAVTTEMSLDANMPDLYLNTGQIKQVLLNIILNAIDAMNNGGKLYVTSIFGAGSAEVTVQDTGTGIPKENMDKIFDLFYTTKGDKGTGLGLSISFEIIKNHNGRLLIDSEPGKGTKVSIIFPV